ARLYPFVWRPRNIITVDQYAVIQALQVGIFRVATAGIMRGVMFLRHTKRKKDGKEHRYWSIVENRRVGGGRVVQRPLLYLGEINDSQELAWRKSIAVVEEGAAAPRPLSLFPEARCEGVLPDAAVVRLKLAELRLCRPPLCCTDRQPGEVSPRAHRL